MEATMFTRSTRSLRSTCSILSTRATHSTPSTHSTHATHSTHSTHSTRSTRAALPASPALAARSALSALPALVALTLTLACGTGGAGLDASEAGEVDSALSREYGGLLEREHDGGDRLPALCRELAADIEVRDIGETDDGRRVGRGTGTLRDLEDGSVRDIRSHVFGQRASSRERVFFAAIRDADGDVGVIAGRFDRDGRLHDGRVLDGHRRVRGLVVGEREDGNLRLRIRLACRDLLNEGERESHDEDNADAERAAQERREEEAREEAERTEDTRG
jgi:hypothetical protein